MSFWNNRVWSPINKFESCHFKPCSKKHSFKLCNFEFYAKYHHYEMYGNFITFSLPRSCSTFLRQLEFERKLILIELRSFFFHKTIDLMKEVHQHYCWSCCKVNFDFLSQNNCTIKAGCHIRLSMRFPHLDAFLT